MFVHQYFLFRAVILHDIGKLQELDTDATGVAEYTVDLEEERRLFYVGCTRAKKELQLLSYQGNSGEISPFIKELKSSESDTSDKVDLDVHLKY